MAERNEETLMVIKMSLWRAFLFPFRKFMMLYLLIIVAVAYMAFLEFQDAMLQYLFYALIAVYFILYIGYIFRVRKKRIELTNLRIIYRERAAVRQDMHIPLDKVINMKVRTTRFGRLLKYGHIEVNMAGLDSVRFEYARRPYEFVEHFFSVD